MRKVLLRYGAVKIPKKDKSIFQLPLGFPGGSDGKASACNVGDLGSIPGSGRSSGEGNGNLLQNSHLRNPLDREVWRATFYGNHKRVGHNLATKQQLKHNLFRTSL